MEYRIEKKQWNVVLTAAESVFSDHFDELVFGKMLVRANAFRIV